MMKKLDTMFTQRQIVTTTAVILLNALAASCCWAQSFNYPTFTNTTGLLLRDSATNIASEIRLVTLSNNMQGAVWYSNKVSVVDGFDTTFTFHIGGGSGADGLAFVLLDGADGVNYALGIGGGLGYANLPRALAVEFDTYQNTFQSDPNGNHVGAIAHGQVPSIATHYASAFGSSTFTPGFTLRDGVTHFARVKYVPGKLEIYVGYTNLPASPSITYAANLNSVNGSSIIDADGKTYVGFTSSTGNFNDNHYISSWSFASTPYSAGTVTNSQIYHSAEVRWFAATGQLYRVEYSGDMTNWFPIPFVYPGTGAPIRYFERTDNVDRFWRVVGSPSP